MSVSTVSSPPPPAPIATSTSKAPEKAPDKTAEVKADSDANDAANAYQPTPKPPLPPGQGTRVDQLA